MTQKKKKGKKLGEKVSAKESIIYHNTIHTMKESSDRPLLEQIPKARLYVLSSFSGERKLIISFASHYIELEFQIHSLN